MRDIRSVLVLLLAFFGMAPAGAPAAEHTQEPVAVEFHVVRNVPLGESVDTVCCSGRYRFAVEAVPRVLIGYGQTTTWLRIDLATRAELLQLVPILDEATLFARAADGSWRTSRTGDQIAFDERDRPSPFMVLPIPTDIGEPTVYVRIVQSTAAAVSAMQWTPPAFVEMETRNRTVRAFQFGFIFAMLMFNSVVWLLVRDIAFLLNACSVAGMLVLALYLSGYGAAYVWPFLPGASNDIFIGGLVFSVVVGSAFMWVFIRRPDEGLIAGWPMLAASVSALLAGAVYLTFAPYHIVNPWLLVTVAALLLCSAGFAARRAWLGDTRARILLVPLLAAIVPGTLLVALDRLAGIRLVPFANDALEIMLSVETVLFSLALIARIRQTERAAREAGERLLSLREEGAARAIAIQDAERRRIAAELHDGAGQAFLLVLNGLRQLMRDTAPAGHRDELGKLAGSAESALADLRRISRDMHPSALEHLGLAGALDGLFARLVSEQISAVVDVSIDDAALPADTKLHLYRIAQECLANTLRHARATRCRLTIAKADGALTMRFEDDGVGVGELPDRRKGLGFTSIADRVRTLGGHWSIARSDLGGLAVSVRIPMTPDGVVRTSPARSPQSDMSPLGVAPNGRPHPH